MIVWNKEKNRVLYTEVKGIRTYKYKEEDPNYKKPVAAKPVKKKPATKKKPVEVINENKENK